MLRHWFAVPSAMSSILFVVGWCAGWVCFVGAARRGGTRRYTARSLGDSSRRDPVSVVVPCRNEEGNVPALLGSLQWSLQSADQVIVVDDNSIDATSRVAEECGATVIHVGLLPDGWAGKPYACWLGARHGTHETIIFIDADVRVGPNAIDDIVNVLDEYPTAVVSVMPWHRTGTLMERLSMMFNVVSSLVGGIQTRHGTRRVAYGPFMAVRRDVYMSVGGHANDRVRRAVVEDLAIARTMPESVALLGREKEVEYRMYPHGWNQLLEGWTKNTALGAVSVPRWSAIGTIVWVASLCGGVVTSPWFYVLSAGQMWMFSRRVGNFGPISVLLYPVHAMVFVGVALRSAVRSALFGSVTWRGRRIGTR